MRASYVASRPGLQQRLGYYGGSAGGAGRGAVRLSAIRSLPFLTYSQLSAREVLILEQSDSETVYRKA